MSLQRILRTLWRASWTSWADEWQGVRAPTGAGLRGGDEATVGADVQDVRAETKALGIHNLFTVDDEVYLVLTWGEEAEGFWFLGHVA